MDTHLEIHCIDDKSSDSMPTDDSVNMLQIELTNKTGTYLQHLNEDCLLEIFSSKSLTLMDLCSLAETCKRFNQITQRIFPKEVSIEGGRKCGSYRFRLKNNLKVYDTVQDVERVLKNFGPYLSALWLLKDVAVVNPVANYCGTGSLKRLTIHSLKISESITLKLKSILQRLLVLYIVSSDLTKIVRGPYINCDSLIELEIVRSSGCAAILKNTFSNLEQFRFYGCLISENYEDYSDLLLKFIGRHKRLRTLNLSAKSVSCSSELLHTIDHSCKELTELTLRDWEIRKTSFDFPNLLPKLRMLDVDFDLKNCGQLIALLKELKSLETLKLGSSEEVPVEFFNVLSQLGNLRELHLEFFDFKCIPWTKLTQLKKLCLPYIYIRNGYANELFDIVRQLINLEELEFDKYQVLELSKKDFSEIVKIVDQRANVLTIKCKLDKNMLKNCDKNGKVRLINWE